MNKATRILLAIGLILAVAAPAFAEFKFNGVFNTKFYAEQKKSTSTDEGDSQQFIDQRFRAKLTYSLNDNVAVVYYGEVDTVWGEESKGNIGDGGQVTYRTTGADGVNVETKNVYLDMKFGDTTATLGIQTFGDAFEGVVAFDDMAGIKVTHKIGNTTLTGLYSKWDEDYATTNSATTTEVEVIPGNDTNTTTLSLNTAKPRSRSDWDDFDFYAAEVKHKFSDSFTAGAGVYLMDDSRDSNTVGPTTYNKTAGDKEVFFYGVNAAYTSGDFGVQGFAMLQDGEYDDVTAADKDFDYTGWLATVKGTMKLTNGDIGLRLIYITDDDDSVDEGSWQGFQGEYGAWVNENQMQFLVDKNVANDGKEQYAIADAVYQGYGLMAIILSGNHKLPDNMYVNWGLGYYEALEDSRNNEASKSREGTTLGYEGCVRVGKKFFDKVDISLNASYADYGDFYDESTTKHNSSGSSDPDATYKTYVMVNVPF